MEILLPSTTLSVRGREEATNYIRASMELGSKPLEGEYKTPEELEMVGKVDIALGNLFRLLNIPELYRGIKPEQVHYLNEDAYKSFSPNARSGAVTELIGNAIVLNRDDPMYADYSSKLFRLGTHLSAKNTFRFNEDKLVVAPRQSGLLFNTNSSTAGLAFEGFNEAIVDMTARVTQVNNFELFFGENATTQNTEHSLGSYPMEVDIFEHIVDGVVKKRGVSPMDVVLTFCRAQFTGDTRPYTLIDYVFGAGSLKLLATLGHERSKPDLSAEEQAAFRENILNHFKKKN